MAAGIITKAKAGQTNEKNSERNSIFIDLPKTWGVVDELVSEHLLEAQLKPVATVFGKLITHDANTECTEVECQIDGYLLTFDYMSEQHEKQHFFLKVLKC